MKNTISLFAIVAALIGLLGVVEAIADASPMQGFICAGLIWGSMAFYKDSIKSLKKDEQL